MSWEPEGWDPSIAPEIRAFIVGLWKASFGATADTDPDTPDGHEIDIIKLMSALCYDTNTALWANSFLRSSSGVPVDYLLDLFAKLREPASESIGSTIFYGTPATAIPAATTVLTADQAATRFGTDALANVGAASASDTWMVRVLAPGGVIVTGENYITTIDANPPNVYAALGGDTATDVVEGLRDLIILAGFATAANAGTDASLNGLLAIDIIGGPGDVVASSTAPGTVIEDYEAVRVPVTALSTGVLLAPAGTLQALANPIVGILGASNDADITPGATQESDDVFKARHIETMFANTARTDQGMRAAVAALGATPTTGVLENSVVSNRTVDPEDADGRPIGSVENIILQDGSVTDAEIANAIARQLVGGVEPYGLRSFGLGVTVDGENVEIFATDVEQLYLHLNVTITTGEGFPIGGDIEGTIAQAVASYFDTGLISTDSGDVFDPTAKLVVGKDMLRVSVTSPVNSVTNNATTSITVTTDVTAAPGDVPTLISADQPATKRQIIRADASRVAVVIV